LDARTGEVLAMANVPTYNPNNPVNIQGKSRNRAITDVFEPGSTLKPMTAAAALESGKYLPETKIQTSPGYMSIGPAVIHDAHPHGILTVAEIIQKSSNVGSAKWLCLWIGNTCGPCLTRWDLGPKPVSAFPVKRPVDYVLIKPGVRLSKPPCLMVTVSV
jgi:cell division protein FtsI/penicillin-binding protein 2